jgi:integrase
MRRITIARYDDLSLNEARAEALRIRHEIAIGADPARGRDEKRHSPTLDYLAKRFLNEHSRLHKRSWREDERIFKAYFQDISGSTLSTISREIVCNWHHRIGIDHGKFQANRCLALLSAIYAWTLRLGHWQGLNPTRGIRRFQEKSRSRFLNNEELSRLWRVLDSEPSVYWRSYFKLALMLGLRRNELLRARWRDLNIAEGIWNLPTTKSGTSHRLPIPRLAIEILERIPKRDQHDWLFPSDRNKGHPLANANHVWSRIRARAGLPDVRIHDLRRTLGSWLATQGCSLPLIGRALNHTNVATTQIYARMNLDPVREALERNASLMLDNGNRPTPGTQVSAVER